MSFAIELGASHVEAGFNALAQFFVHVVLYGRRRDESTAPASNKRKSESAR
jgi:hypothetical protein